MPAYRQQLCEFTLHFILLLFLFSVKRINPEGPSRLKFYNSMNVGVGCWFVFYSKFV